uniref:gap junction beta-2 protein-like n=1 Tax=Styela clava TaxID=7725 RepID=UPI00193A29B7|nr:gap junction beta-2 protein-like [Styela clava]
MLDIIKGFTEQVTEYSTVFGQIWYLVVFLFRGMVVVTIGDEVYSDEQSEFKCSTLEIGCDNVCFSKFSKIAHIRFWAFQLLAVTTPTILFHFFVTGIKSKVEKMKSTNAIAAAAEEHVEDDNWSENRGTFKSEGNTLMKKKGNRKPTKVRFKSVYDANADNMKEIAVTDSISWAYYLNVITRGVVEGVFIYLSYELFKFMDHSREPDHFGVLDFLWFSVPASFKCEGKDIESACNQHTSFGKGGYVPCWVSRPWEKTIFLRYMNVLSALCFILSIVEFFYLTVRGTRTANRRRERKRSRSDSWFFRPDLSAPLSPTLAIPIRLSSVDKFANRKDVFIDVSDDEKGTKPNHKKF